MGLIGNGGVHSNLNHLYALIHLAAIKKFNRVYLHLFSDGRDSPQTSGKSLIANIEKLLKKEEVGRTSSLMGRYWAMDRDQRWDRTQKAYVALTKGVAHEFSSAQQAIEASYAKAITDEFIEPSLINDKLDKFNLIEKDDAVIFFNFRVDRPKQLTIAFVLPDFENLKGYQFDPEPDHGKKENQVVTGSLGEVNRFIAIGGNLRSNATYVDYQDTPDEDLAFDVDELRVYLDVRVIPDRLSLYVDQRLAPDDGRNLEAYARLWLDASQRFYVKAGQMYLPFGLRLEDDTAFVREISGINFDTPDDGVEFGLESGPWSAQLAVSNGTGGGGETNAGKQWSLRGEHVRTRWRLGASYNFNDAGDIERHMGAVHAGLRTGPVTWLAEFDFIEDRGLPGGSISRWVGLLEGNWEPRRGHNLKATAEGIDPASGLDAETQERYSLVYEYAPIQFLQLRGGARVYDGDPLDPQQNREFYFLDLHGFF